MSIIVKFLAILSGGFALIFLFVGLLWTEWPQTLVGLGLAVVAVAAWVAGDRIRARSFG